MPYRASSSSLGESQDSPTAEFCWDASCTGLACLWTVNNIVADKINYYKLNNKHSYQEVMLTLSASQCFGILKLISVISQARQRNACVRSNGAGLFVPTTGCAANLPLMPWQTGC